MCVKVNDWDRTINLIERTQDGKHLSKFSKDTARDIVKNLQLYGHLQD